MSYSISKERIKQIINEEIRRKLLLKEELDIDAIETVSKNAKILLKAAYEFRNNAPPALINAFTPSLKEMIEKLEEMIQSPAQFVSKQRIELSSGEKPKGQTGDLSMRHGGNDNEKVVIKPRVRN